VGIDGTIRIAPQLYEVATGIRLQLRRQLFVGVNREGDANDRCPFMNLLL